MKLFLIALALFSNYVALGQFGNPGFADLLGLGRGLGLGHGLGGLGGHGLGGLGLGHGYGGHGMHSNLYNDPVLKQLLAFQLLKKWEDKVIADINLAADTGGVCDIKAVPALTDAAACVEKVDAILQGYARQIMMVSQMSANHGGHLQHGGFGGLGLGMSMFSNML